ncbi:Peptidase S1, PA clan,Serine proteases, trypsin domain [Cinara cedri]|uniref:Peptidase S1, PA clan,Serine proteases, trypsin domain n=1 Tax=Cinara cedri TaxID=506608 RepID=A0A5E4MLS4_9HEMI|nr:Peptidase S1, PA clan,Serine proteases, trypsin domain [Cinara cedri]
MNICFYLMLVYSVLITCDPINPDTIIEENEMTITNVPIAQRQSSGYYSAQEEILEVNQTIPIKSLQEKVGSVLQCIPFMSKNLVQAVTTDLFACWRSLQLQNQIENTSFVESEDFFQLNVKFDDLLFGPYHFEFTRVNERNTKKDVSTDEGEDSDEEDKNTMLPYWRNVIPITTEEEFIKRASNKHYFPYHVVITMSINENEKWCQGALIRSNWMITSKSCLKKHFDVKTKEPVYVFLDAINHKDSKIIYYSNVVLSDHITVGPTLLEPDSNGLDDLVVLKMVKSQTKKVPVVALKIPESDIVEDVHCNFVTRCSDGVVRSMLYELAGMATQKDLGFLKPGSIILCDNYLLSIKTNGTSFYSLIKAFNWIEKSIQEGESDT